MKVNPYQTTLPIDMWGMEIPEESMLNNNIWEQDEWLEEGFESTPFRNNVSTMGIDLGDTPGGVALGGVGDVSWFILAFAILIYCSFKFRSFKKERG